MKRIRVKHKTNKLAKVSKVAEICQEIQTPGPFSPATIIDPSVYRPCLSRLFVLPMCVIRSGLVLVFVNCSKVRLEALSEEPSGRLILGISRILITSENKHGHFCATPATIESSISIWSKNIKVSAEELTLRLLEAVLTQAVIPCVILGRRGACLGTRRSYPHIIHVPSSSS